MHEVQPAAGGGARWVHDAPPPTTATVCDFTLEGRTGEGLDSHGVLRAIRCYYCLMTKAPVLL